MVDLISLDQVAAEQEAWRVSKAEGVSAEASADSLRVELLKRDGGHDLVIRTR